MLELLRRFVSDRSSESELSHMLFVETLKIWKTCAQYEIEEPPIDELSLLSDLFTQTTNESSLWISKLRNFSEKSSSMLNLFEIGCKAWKRVHKSLIDSVAMTALSMLQKLVHMWTELEHNNQIKENRNLFYSLVGNLLHFLAGYTENVDNNALSTQMIPLLSKLVESNSFFSTLDFVMKALYLFYVIK